MPDPTLMFPALEDAVIAAQTTVGEGWMAPQEADTSLRPARLVPHASLASRAEPVIHSQS